MDSLEAGGAGVNFRARPDSEVAENRSSWKLEDRIDRAFIRRYLREDEMAARSIVR
jgi:hypothetical protein